MLCAVPGLTYFPLSRGLSAPLDSGLQDAPRSLDPRESLGVRDAPFSYGLRHPCPDGHAGRRPQRAGTASMISEDESAGITIGTPGRSGASVI